MEAVQSGEERAPSCLELDIYPLISVWVHGYTAKLKVKIPLPPTLTLALAFSIPFQDPPRLGRGNLDQVCTSHSSPVVQEGT